jgi:hypothetical protein
LKDRPPTNLAELAKAYGQVFSGVEGIWEDFSRRSVLNGAPTSGLPDPALEEIRQVFHAADAAPAVPFDPAGGLTLLPDRASQAEYKTLLQAVETFRLSGPGAPARAMVVEDVKQPFDSRIFRRGNPGNQGDVAPRRFLKAISQGERPTFREGSGRLELALSIASRENPLTARVLVNRVWMHHFGAAIVTTPSDFGTRGELPSHPELLDYLSAEFVGDGWSLKRLHKRLLLSATYLQSSDDRPEARAVDPENVLLWRMNRRRLDFEATRDAVLSVSGRLDPAIGGPPVDDLFAANFNRRTIYGKIDRLNLPGVYRAFDFPDPSASNPKRDRTTVAPQALFLMNHRFAMDASAHLFERSEIAGETDAARRVDRLYHLLFGRTPTAEETSLGLDFVRNDSGAWTRYVQGLIMTNEFMFLD